MRPSSAAQLDGVETFHHGDRRRGECGLRRSACDLKTGAVARHMHDARGGVCRFTARRRARHRHCDRTGRHRRSDRQRGLRLRVRRALQCRDRKDRRRPRSYRPRALPSVSPGATAAAMPPCAHTLEPVVPGRAPQRISEGKGASLSAVNNPARPAPKISAPLVSMTLSMRSAMARSRGRALFGHLHLQHPLDGRARAHRDRGIDDHFRRHRLQRMQISSAA